MTLYTSIYCLKKGSTDVEQKQQINTDRVIENVHELTLNRIKKYIETCSFQ